MKAFLEGWRRVLRAPAVTSGLLIGTMIITLLAPPAIYGQFHGAALNALRWVFAHESLGFGGVTATFLSFDTPAAFVEMMTFWSLNVIFWMFISGGALDRLARDRATRTGAFFSACGVQFFRFLRLGVLLAIPFGLLLQVLLGATQSAAVEILIVVALTVWSAVGDYAKVRLVVEDRHSALGALSGSIRFIWRHPLQTFVLYLLNAIVMAAALTVGRRFTPPATITVVAVLLAIMSRMAFMASSIALFQSKLAHAGYVAAPLPMWPDSPSAEAMQNLIDRKTS